MAVISTRFSAYHAPSGALLIEITGDLSGREGTALVPGLISALRGKALARRARKAGVSPMPAPSSVVVDISRVTCLGFEGAALLWGIFRMAPCAVVCRAGSWTPTINLICRAKKSGATPITTIL